MEDNGHIHIIHIGGQDNRDISASTQHLIIQRDGNDWLRIHGHVDGGRIHIAVAGHQYHVCACVHHTDRWNPIIRGGLPVSHRISVDGVSVQHPLVRGIRIRHGGLHIKSEILSLTQFDVRALSRDFHIGEHIHIHIPIAVGRTARGADMHPEDHLLGLIGVVRKLNCDTRVGGIANESGILLAFNDFPSVKIAGGVCDAVILFARANFAVASGIGQLFGGV